MSRRGGIKTLCILTLSTVLTSCGGSYESEDREKLSSSFEKNFGFKPPNSIKEIKLKNWGLYDAAVHWMAFTYDSNVLSKIIVHDKPLKIASYNSSEFLKIVDEIRKSKHNPEWLDIPGVKTERIYYKRNFLTHTFSEYYLWTNKESKMTFLFVHYFD